MALGSGDSGAAVRSVPALLCDRVFGTYYFTRLLSSMGVWIHSTSAAILVWELTRSPLFVAGVSLAQHLPFVLAPWAGSRADRGNRRRQVVMSRSLVAAGSASVALWIYSTGPVGTGGAVGVIVGSLLCGVGFALGLPAMEALLPQLVRKNELATAIALSSSIKGIAMAAGPALAAAAVALADINTAFVAAATMSATFAIVIARLPFQETTMAATGASSVRDGLDYVRATPTLVALLLGVVAVGIGTDPVVTLTPVVVEELGETSAYVGLLASLFGMGAIVGFVAIPRLLRSLSPRTMALVGLRMMAIAIVALLVAPSVPAAGSAMALNGAGMASALSSLTTMVQTQAPEAFRARIMALWGLAYIGSRPIAAGTSGALAETLSLDAALVAIAATLLGGSIIVARRSPSIGP